MKKILFIAIIVSILHFSYARFASGGDIDILRPAGNSSDVIPLLYLKNVQKQRAAQSQQMLFDSNGIIDTLTWRNPDESQLVNFGFLNQGDSMLVWFDPPAYCRLVAIRFQPYNWEGNLLIDVWDASNYNPLVYSMDSTDANGWWGTFDPIDCGSCWVSGLSDHSPLGWTEDDPEHHLWGPFPSTVTAAHGDMWIEIRAAIGPQGEVDLGRDPFYIGACFYPTAGWGFYGQQAWSTPYNLFKFYSECCGPDSIHDGWFIRSYSVWFEAVVEFDDCRCRIRIPRAQNFTYAPGPYPIEAFIEDACASHPDESGIASAELVYTLNGIIYRQPMEGPPQGGLFMAEIPELAVWDTVTYRVEATGQTGLSCQSTNYVFARIEPQHPEADILVIWDNKRNPELDTFYIDLFNSFETQYEYELWNMGYRNGIDASVINWGWQTIYISGWGCRNTLPGFEYEGNPFVEWLEAGTVEEPHNLLYIDQDYFCVQDDYGCEWDEELSERDFMYAYFGVTRAISDNHGSEEAGYDSVTFGELGTEFEEIRVNFLPDILHPTHPENWLWPDWLIELTEDAEQIFRYKDNEFGAGVRLDRNHYRTVYLPWPDFFAVDSLENGDLVPREGLTQAIENILEWFGTRTSLDVTDGEVRIPGGYHLAQNYPNPFNSATVIRYQIGDSRSPVHTTLKVFNILGQEIQILLNELREPGAYTIQWDGRDNKGAEVSSGVYFYRLKVGNYICTKRMILLR